MMSFASASNDSLPRPESADILGFPVHLLSDYLSWIQTRWQHGQGAHIITLNPEMVMLAEQQPALASAIAQADLVIPDGIGVILSLRLQGKKQQRCPGIELAASLIKGTAQGITEGPIFFYGGVPGRAETAAQSWQQQYPQLSIDTQHGYLSPSEQTELSQQLREQQPRLILVGLGVPRQELWIARNRHLCPNAIWMGVGGTFDIWAGAKPRAPQWCRHYHLEWLYRLYQEPSRWRRMLLLPTFAWQTLLHRYRH